MAIQTTANLSNAIRTKYGNVYIEAAMFNRVYDMFAAPVGREGVEDDAFLGNSVQVNFLSDMPPGTSTISEISDVVPSTLRDATATISPTSRWGALSWAEALDLKAYTNYGEGTLQDPRQEPGRDRGPSGSGCRTSGHKPLPVGLNSCQAGCWNLDPSFD